MSQCHQVITVLLCAFSHHTLAGCIADSEMPAHIPFLLGRNIWRVFIIPEWGPHSMAGFWHCPLQFATTLQRILTRYVNTFINQISSSEFPTAARQIWHWLWQCASGHPSIKWRAAEKVTEQFVCLHPNCRWINSAKGNVKHHSRNVSEVLSMSWALCVHITQMSNCFNRILSFTSRYDPKMNCWRGVRMSSLTDSAEPLWWMDPAGTVHWWCKTSR